MARHQASVIAVGVQCVDVDAATGKVAEVEVALFSMMIVNCSDDGAVPAIHGEIVDEIGFLTGYPTDCLTGYLIDCLIDCLSDFLSDCLIASEIEMETGTAPLLLLTAQWIETAIEKSAIGTANVRLTDESDSIDEVTGTLDAPIAMIETDHWNLGKEQIVLRAEQTIMALLDQHHHFLNPYPLDLPLLVQTVRPINHHWTKTAKDLYYLAHLPLTLDATASVPKPYLVRSPPKSPLLFLNTRLPRQPLKSLHLDSYLLPFQLSRHLKGLPKDALEAMPRYRQRKIAQMRPQCNRQLARRQIEEGRLIK